MTRSIRESANDSTVAVRVGGGFAPVTGLKLTHRDQSVTLRGAANRRGGGESTQ